MKKVIFALAICASIVSCQKEEDTKPIDVSKTVYLMDKSWVVKAWSIRPDVSDTLSAPDSTYFNSINGCEKDNYLVFNSSSRASIHEGSSKCDQQAPDSVMYGYTLSNNDSHILIFTNPDEVDHGTYIDGEIKYASIDTFSIKYRLPKPGDSSITQEFIKTYVKH
ncbi:hypothetical protein F0919_09510 [Taibaiella lutea]|uniref:Lipocalin-like domain-containing protein n=1 Tax=Taibaiella lutea TaxID=2608001 RepID=A0A5M6CI98_9BACT|nr:hypothetical protein [Taibaiella lutea]KAA5534834.1 hypothetical protein F0919_09510 [Taibaiella lutea]